MPYDEAVWLGTATIDPSRPVTAGAFGTWTITFRVGRFGIDNSGGIKICTRMVCDWGNPQMVDPTGPGYTTVRTNGAAKLRVHFDPKGGIRPFRRALVVDVYDGSLAEDDLIVVTWGDRSGGGPGCRAQTYPDERFEFRVLVDAMGTSDYRVLRGSPCLVVEPGAPDHLAVVAPSLAHFEQTTWATVRVEDAWGNPTPRFQETVRVTSNGSVVERRFRPEDRGTHRFTDLPLTMNQPVMHVHAETSDGLTATSNPIVRSAGRHSYFLGWGDTQGQSGGTVGTGRMDRFFAYARDVACLDFVVHSGNDFQITPEQWEETRRNVEQFHEPGRFQPFLSYEWSGNTPAGGDYNIIYRGAGPIHRSSHWLIDDKSDENTDRYPIGELWKELAGRTDVLAVPHVGGRRARTADYDENICRVVELASVHGWFEWLGLEALAAGLKVGFVGASDDHSGRPGLAPATADELLVRGGLAAVYSERNSREAIFDALRARRTYGTTGERIVLWVDLNGHPLGSECTISGRPRVSVRVDSPSPLERIDVLKGTEVIHRERFGAPGRRLRVSWTGAENDTRGRVTCWDGGLTLTSGRIVSVEPWAFVRPSEGIVARGERSIRWRSSTAGDPDGLILDLDAPDDAELVFETGPANFRARPSAIREAPFVVDAGKKERQVVVERIPDETGPTSARVSWEDPAPGAGGAYWVRVVLASGGRAWSSPIFAMVEGV